MYPIPPNEKLVETKVCRHCGVSFPITDKDLEFYDKVSPVFGGKKYSIPTPTLCPDCRQQRRLSFRNERKLYKRKCDATGRDIVSIYAPCEIKGSLEAPLGCSPDKPFKVYHQDFWWSDKWDPMDYGREFDFGRRFFEQFGELNHTVPTQAIYLDSRMENSDYCNYGYGCKNCYLCVNAYKLEDSFYCTSAMGIDGIANYNVDCSDCLDCENIYMSQRCKNSQQVFYSAFCEGCQNCWNCLDCKSCKNCIGCKNLVNKECCILNEQVTQDEFEAFLKNYKNSDGSVVFSEKFNRLCSTIPHKSSYIFKSENCIGDDIVSCQNCTNCFLALSINNGKYCYDSGYFSSNIFDGMNAGDYSDMLYEACHAHRNFKSAFILDIDDGQEVFYNRQCYASSHLFGCIGLRNKSYCILNKQYTKEEYEVLVPKIIEHMRKTGEWGEFFPASLSPFGYNETVAQEYYPLTKEQATMDGVFNWSDYEPPFPKVEKIIPASKLPEDITKVPDDILNWAIECEVTKKPFRIIKQELEFYRKHNLPIPRRHPDQRHLDRMALRNPRKLFERLCDCSNCEMNHTVKGIILDDTNSGYKEDPETSSGGRRVKMITTYAPERPERVYCEECYNREVV